MQCMTLKANLINHHDDYFYSGAGSTDHEGHGFSHPSHETFHGKSCGVHLKTHWVHAIDEGLASQSGNIHGLSLLEGCRGQSHWFSSGFQFILLFFPTWANFMMIGTTSCWSTNIVEIEGGNLIQNSCRLLQLVFYINSKILMNLEIKIMYENLKSVNLLAFIIWSWITKTKTT